MKIIFVRQEDYWVFPLSFFGVLFTTIFLYAGVMWMRLLAGLAGFSILYFMLYIIRKNYGRKYGARYMLICLLSAILLALGIHLLTN